MWVAGSSPQTEDFSTFMAALSQVRGCSTRNQSLSLAARQEDLNSAAIFFLGLILADTPLRAGFALAATSQDGKDSVGALAS